MSRKEYEYTKKKFFEITGIDRCGRCYDRLSDNPLKQTEVILSNKFTVDDEFSHYFICRNCTFELEEFLTASNMLNDEEKKSLE